MKLHPINAGNFKLDGGAMFGVVPKALWQRTNPADENNMINMAIRSGHQQVAGQKTIGCIL